MFCIVTDSSSNIEKSVLDRNGISSVPFSYNLEGNDTLCPASDEFDGHDYYDKIRGGEKVTTSQVPPQRYIDYIEPLLKNGSDVLYVGMSSGISGSYNSAEIAAKQLREEYPERKIRLVDTLAASLGEGLLVLKAAELREAGKSIDAVADTLLELRKNMIQIFTVGDLMHLTRTGRLSNLAGVIGVVLHIKPLLKGNDEGKIVCFAKIRGRRASLEAMAKKYDELVVDAGEQTVGIAHTDCAEDAELLAQLLRRNNPPRDIMTVCYEPVTGSHVGPDTVAFFFMGKGRDF